MTSEELEVNERNHSMLHRVTYPIEIGLRINGRQVLNNSTSNLSTKIRVASIDIKKVITPDSGILQQLVSLTIRESKLVYRYSKHFMQSSLVALPAS